MSAAQPALFRRLQQTGAQADWGRLVDLFSAHLFLWGCRAGLQGPEAAELVRGVFAVLARELPAFVLGRAESFRAWLRLLAGAQRAELLRKRPAPAGGAVAVAAGPPPVTAAAEAVWEADYLPLLLKAAVTLMQPDFPPAEWKACWGVTVEGRPAADVARELGVSVVDVYAAEERVLRRLRQELEGLLE
jgi:DNA-directed RNA polymerase specialized sigma24 family protein